MDDKELIKRIMEEVKDEKLREELLALVVEKNRKKDDIKQEEEKYIDYVAKQAILFGATEGVAKVYWWIGYIIFIVFVLAGLFAFLVFLAYTFEPDAGRPGDNITALVISMFLLLIGLGGVFSLHSGKKRV
jgi:phage shock protein PspC (stress-responsive transcriptional regulator)